MNAFKRINKFWKEETKFEFEWDIYYRKKPVGSILDDSETSFQKLKMPKGFWCADPIAFKDDKFNLLFFELYDKKNKKGKLAYVCIDDIDNSSIDVCLEENNHLSFPFVFKQNESYYMIPETGASKTIMLYEAIDFPKTWKDKKVLAKDVIACDSIVFNNLGKTFVLSSTLKDNAIYCSNRLFELNDCFELSDIKKETKYSNEGIRNGGPLFQYKGKFFRPGQFGTRGDYGRALYIWSFDISSGTDIKIEKIINTSDLAFVDSEKKEGIHSYSATDEFEFIDTKRIIKNNFFKRFGMLIKATFKHFRRN